MKLTNLQLDILTKRISQSVQTEKEKFMESPEYLKEAEKVKQEASIVEATERLTRYFKLQDKLEDLRKELNNNKQLFNDLIKDGGYTPSNSRLKAYLALKIEKALNNKFPTTQEIKEEIIVATMEGSKDIISTVLEVFNIKRD